MKLLGAALHLNMPAFAYLPACLSTYPPTALDTYLGEIPYP